MLIAALVAGYAVALPDALVITEWTELTFTIAPPPPSTMARAASWLQ